MSKLMKKYMDQGVESLNKKERIELAQDMLELRMSEIHDILGVPIAYRCFHRFVRFSRSHEHLIYCRY